MKSNIHKKVTEEDKLYRKYFSKHRRLSILRTEKKQQRKKFRKYTIDKHDLI